MRTLDCLAAARTSALALVGRVRWLGPLLARVVVGWVFLESGWGKLHNLEKVTEFFRSLGIPHPELQAPFAASTELVCGALLLVGLATRFAAVPLMVVMTVALRTALADEINDLSDLFGKAEFLYIVVLLGLALEGAGCLSLDAWLGRLLRRRLAPGPPG